MTDMPETTKRFNDCLLRFQALDPFAAEEFQILIRPYLFNLARKIAPQMPPDLHEEMVQQTALNLLGNSKMKFDPQRAAAKKFLVLALRNAIRKVRRDCCPPGRTTRPAKSDGREEAHQTVVSIEELDEAVHSKSSAKEIIMRCEVSSLLRLAPQPVAVTLERIHYSGDKLIEVAKDLNMSRFKLSRDIATYCERMQNVAKFGNVTLRDRIAC